MPDTDVNKYAAEGGDTAPSTRKEIAERNKAADKVAEAAAERGRVLRDAEDEHAQAMAKAQEEYDKAVPRPDVVGAKAIAEAAEAHAKAAG